MSRHRPWRAVRALLFAAVAGGIGYLIADRLLGLTLEPPPPPREPADDVTCTVFAPVEVAAGDAFLVQAYVHLHEDDDDVRALALEMDTDAARRVYRSLEAPVPRGSRLHFELHAPGLVVDDPVTSLVWRGSPEAAQFGVTVPPGAAGTVIATLFVSLDSAPLGHVKFKLKVAEASVAAAAMRRSAHEVEPQGDVAHRYGVAFISYASKDRDEVLKRVQGIAALKASYFQDVLSLEPGDRWARRIELGIDECDVFLLFWSRNAKASRYVRQEVARALERSGADGLDPPAIRPVIIEGPPVIEPWEELEHLHFSDSAVYLMNR